MKKLKKPVETLRYPVKCRDVMKCVETLWYPDTVERDIWDIRTCT